jgi:hypothetical protein
LTLLLDAPPEMGSARESDVFSLSPPECSRRKVFGGQSGIFWDARHSVQPFRQGFWPRDAL